MLSIVHVLRQLVLSPTAFFKQHPPAETFRMSSGIVVLYWICLTITPLLLGTLLAGAIDTTVAVDNPHRPPPSICNAENIAESAKERCAQPKTVDRDVGDLVQTALVEYVWVGIVLPVIMFPLGWITLYGAGRLGGGTPSLEGTFALAGWAALPELVRLVVALIGLQLTLGEITITDPDPERMLETLQAATAPIGPILFGATVLTLIWQWSLLSGGLSEDADIQWRVAAVCVAVPVGIIGLFVL